MRKNVFVYVALALVVIALAPAFSFCADLASMVCPEGEAVKEQNICEPIVINTEMVTKCPEGYTLEGTDEKKSGAVQRGIYFFRCIVRKPGMQAYIISEGKKSFMEKTTLSTKDLKFLKYH